MDKRIGLFAGLTALFAMGSAHAYECPTAIPVKLTVDSSPCRELNPETGHTFEVYKADGICWEDAKAFVASLPRKAVVIGRPHHLGLAVPRDHHLVQREQWIVDKLLKEALKVDDYAHTAAQSQVWVGGSATGCDGCRAGGVG